MIKFLFPLIAIVAGIAFIGGLIYVTVPKSGNNQTTPKIAPTGQTKEFNLTLFNFGFEPDMIEVNAGDEVKLNVTTRDIDHGIGINEFMVNKRVQPGQVAAVEFLADKRGEFRMYCTVPCGDGHLTMEGKLIVK